MNTQKKTLAAVALLVVAVAILGGAAVRSHMFKRAGAASVSDGQYAALLKKGINSGDLPGWQEWHAAHPGNPGDPGAAMRMDQPPARLATKNKP